MFAHLGSAWDFSSFSQWRYALRRQSSSHSGSVFFAEMVRMISSLRPGGIDSDSMSLTKPYLYSRSARISALFAGLAIISALNRERSSAPAGALDVRVLEHEPRLHQLFFVVELGAVKKKAGSSCQRESSRRPSRKPCRRDAPRRDPFYTASPS